MHRNPVPKVLLLPTLLPLVLIRTKHRKKTLSIVHLPHTAIRLLTLSSAQKIHRKPALDTILSYLLPLSTTRKIHRKPTLSIHLPPHTTSRRLVLMSRKRPNQQSIMKPVSLPKMANRLNLVSAQKTDRTSHLAMAMVLRAYLPERLHLARQKRKKALENTITSLVTQTWTFQTGRIKEESKA
jgi:hypothetical protein